jgi:hypothetical protein
MNSWHVVIRFLGNQIPRHSAGPKSVHGTCRMMSQKRLASFHSCTCSRHPRTIYQRLLVVVRLPLRMHSSCIAQAQQTHSRRTNTACKQHKRSIHSTLFSHAACCVIPESFQSHSRVIPESFQSHPAAGLPAVTLGENHQHADNPVSAHATLTLACTIRHPFHRALTDCVSMRQLWTCPVCLWRCSRLAGPPSYRPPTGHISFSHCKTVSWWSNGACSGTFWMMSLPLLTVRRSGGSPQSSTPVFWSS